MPGPGFIPAVDAAKVVISGQFRAQQYDIDLWFLHDVGAITFNDLNDLCLGLSGAFVGTYLAPLSSDLSLDRIVARDYTTQSGPVVDMSFTALLGEEGDAMPNNVALSVSFRTGFAGRSNRGRNYVGAIPRANVVENQVDTTFAGIVKAAYDSIIGANTVAPGWSWAVASFKTAGAWRTAAQVVPIQTVVIVDRTVDTMQKRLPGRGK